jgi:hypothetical protein
MPYRPQHKTNITPATLFVIIGILSDIGMTSWQHESSKRNSIAGWEKMEIGLCIMAEEFM